jgi:protein gp37
MAETSTIEWTEATWNPVTGCQVLSPGCKRCYAMKLAGTRLRNHHSRKGLTIATANGPVWNGTARFNEVWLDQPLRWTRPRPIFVCAHADLFYEEVLDWWIERVFGIAIAAHHLRGHVLQFLTKRSDRMRDMLNSESFWDAVNAIASEIVMERVDPLARRSNDARATLDTYGPDKPPPGLWIGVSVEDKPRRDRIDDLRATPAWRRWISAEPLLESLMPLDLSGTHCVEAGGESGDGGRPCHPQWVREIRDACAAQGVDFGFKQWGQWMPLGGEHRDSVHLLTYAGRIVEKAEADHHRDVPGQGLIEIACVGKKRSGRLLDGRLYDGKPV